MTNSTEISIALEELLPFLDVLTPVEYKLKILEHLTGMTGTGEGVAAIIKNTKMTDKFMDLICNDQDNKTRIECLKIFVNVTSGVIPKEFEEKLLKEYFVCFLLRVLIVNDADSADMSSMLLSNLTQNEQNCSIVLKCIKEDEMVSLDKLVHSFCVENFNKHCSLHHLGTLLSNLTVLPEVRDLMLINENSAFTRVLPFINYEKSALRRLATARMVKNCLFNTDCHEWVLSQDVDIVTHLLLPLAGPEEFTAEENDELPLDLQYLPSNKTREKNQEIIILLLEALFQLCATKSCRLKMKSNGAYYILREFHKTLSEENYDVLHPLENLVQILIGDEPDCTEHNNLKEVEIPAHIAKKLENIAV